jgi:6,7-dimethyl-8-ribityllumazine synthase
MSSIKGPAEPDTKIDGSPLRIAIVHARWNKVIIDALVAGAISKLKACGVKESNIVTQSVPGSFELPFACSRVIAASRVQAGGNLLGSMSLLHSRPGTPAMGGSPSNQPFDAVIAIGVLIKGATMHFEYISDSVAHGLMKVQLESGVPVIFGVLTALSDEQALERAGKGGHNHGEDWGLAAVDMGTSTRRWAEGRFA